MLRFAGIALGCKVNPYESRCVGQRLRRRGWQEAAPHTADPVRLVIVNTCCVTVAAAAKSRRALRLIARRRPAADIQVMGCPATEQGQALRAVAAQAGCANRVHLAGHADDAADCIDRVAAELREPAQVGGSRTLGRMLPPSLAGARGNKGWMTSVRLAFPATASSRPAGVSSCIKPSPPPGVKCCAGGTWNLPPAAKFPDRAWPSRSRGPVLGRDQIFWHRPPVADAAVARILGR